MSKELDPQMRQKVLDATETAARLHAGGMDPTDAIEKVARDNGFQPPLIHFVATAFNKSLSMYRMQKAAERQTEFDLADPFEAIHRIYDNVGVQKVAFEPPSKEALTLLTKESGLQKAAADAGTAVLNTPVFADPLDMNLKAAAQEAVQRELTQRREKNSQLAQVMLSRAKQETLQAQELFKKALGETVAEIEQMLPSEIRKVAQNIHNQYAQGDKFTKLLNAHLSPVRQLPDDLQKTAHAVIFPSRAPYTNIVRCFQHAEDVVRCQARETGIRQRIDDLVKEGGVGSLAGTFAANTAANSVARIPLVGGVQQAVDAAGAVKNIFSAADGGSSKLRLEMDPLYQNQEREAESKDAFLQLALYDDDIQQYPYDQTVKAFNSAVQLNPSAVRSQGVLKQLMLQNLASSGQKDLFQIKEETALARQMAEQQAANAQRVDQQEAAAAGGDLEEERHRAEYRQGLQSRLTADEQRRKADRATAIKDIKGEALGAAGQLLEGKKKPEEEPKEEAPDAPESMIGETNLASLQSGQIFDQALAFMTQRGSHTPDEAVTVLNGLIGKGTMEELQAVEEMYRNGERSPAVLAILAAAQAGASRKKKKSGEAKGPPGAKGKDKPGGGEGAAGTASAPPPEDKPRGGASSAGAAGTASAPPPEDSSEADAPGSGYAYEPEADYFEGQPRLDKNDPRYKLFHTNNGQTVGYYKGDIDSLPPEVRKAYDTMMSKPPEKRKPFVDRVTGEVVTFGLGPEPEPRGETDAERSVRLAWEAILNRPRR